VSSLFSPSSYIGPRHPSLHFNYYPDNHTPSLSRCCHTAVLHRTAPAGHTLNFTNEDELDVLCVPQPVLHYSKFEKDELGAKTSFTQKIDNVDKRAAANVYIL
jgi:hypothetical protein